MGEPLLIENAGLACRDHEQSAAFRKVQAAVQDLRSYREPDEHLPRGVATQLRSLIRAAHDPAAAAAVRDAQPEWRALRQPHTAADPGDTKRACARGRTLLENPCAASWTGCTRTGANIASTKVQLQAPAASACLSGEEQSSFACQVASGRTGSIHSGGRLQPETLVVDQVAQWRRQSDACLCRKAGCERYRARKQVAYMLMRKPRRCAHHSHLYDLAGLRQFDVGADAHNFGSGFGVAATPEEAVALTPRRCLHDGGVVVVRGIANGVGYLESGLMYVPSFRPVCEVDLVVSRV